jgi:hypothetical protein
MFLLGRKAFRRGRARQSGCVDFGRDGGGHVGVDADQLRSAKQRHLLGDGIAPIAALRDEARIAEALHQHDPGAGDPDRIPAGRIRLPRKAVAGQRGDYEVECVGRAPAMHGRIGQRLDDLQLLDDRTRPAMGDDDGQRMVVPRADMDEMHVHPIDLGNELRQAVQPRLYPAPIVVARPILRQRLHRLEPYALRCIAHRFPFGKSGRSDPPAQVEKLRVRRLVMKGADSCGTFGGGGLAGWEQGGCARGGRGREQVAPADRRWRGVLLERR